MTTETASRDADTGQFTQNLDNLTGREYENAVAGFSTLPKERADDSGDNLPEAHETGDTVKAAAAALQARRAAADENISVAELTGALPDRDQREARTLTQASEEYSSAKTSVQTFAAGLDLARLADKVDADRAEAVQGDPAKARQLGLDQMPVDPKAETEEHDARQPAPHQPHGPQVDEATARAIDAVEGMSDATKRALKDPEIYKAVSEQMDGINAARLQLDNQVKLASNFALASFQESFPELANLGPTQLEQGLAHLAQTNPARFSAACNILQRVSNLQQQQADQQRVEHKERFAQFEATAREEDARLVQMFGGDEAAADEATAATFRYLDSKGVAPSQRVAIVMANPVLATAEARQALWEAEQYRKIKAAPRAVPKDLPPVQRPGVQTDRPRQEVTNIRGLEKQISNTKNPHEQKRLAAKLIAARRASRGG